MVSKFYKEFRIWVANNPVEAADYEAIFKWGSLFYSGQSTVAFVPELLFATSNLITLHNDTIILKSNDPLKNVSRVKIWLSVLEYSEIFLELGSSRFGPQKKNSVIFFIQLIKCAARLYLLISHKNSLIPNPALQPVERFLFKDRQVNETSTSRNSNGLSKIIREIPQKRKIKNPEALFSNEKFVAEILFTLKPVSHLVARFLFGFKSWNPYVLSMLMDGSSGKVFPDHHPNNLVAACQGVQEGPPQQ